LNLPRFFFIILPLYVIGSAIWMKKNTRGLAIAADKLALFDTTTDAPRSYNRSIIWSLEIASFIFILASVYLLGHMLVEWMKN